MLYGLMLLLATGRLESAGRFDTEANCEAAGKFRIDQAAPGVYRGYACIPSIMVPEPPAGK